MYTMIWRKTGRVYSFQRGKEGLTTTSEHNKITHEKFHLKIFTRNDLISRVVHFLVKIIQCTDDMWYAFRIVHFLQTLWPEIWEPSLEFILKDVYNLQRYRLVFGLVQHVSCLLAIIKNTRNISQLDRIIG